MRLVVASSFPVWPARSGGQARILGLYRALAALGHEIEIVAFAHRRERSRTRALAPGLVETRVPQSPEHEAAERALWRRAGIPVTDVALTLHHELTPAFGDAVARACAGAHAVIASHPFALPAIPDAAPLVYEAHNVEADLKAAMLGEDAAELLAAVREVEHEACTRARLVLCTTAEERDRLAELYAVDRDRAVLVPNGADERETPFVDPEARARRKQALGIADRFQGLFVGSWHEPNLEAVRAILAAARVASDIRFVVCGSAGNAFAERDIPANVDLCGTVDQRFLAATLAIADAAVNPMRTGSGTNLKMLAYALAGLPMISTQTGARGLDLQPGRHFVAAAGDELAAALHALRDEDPASVQARVDAAYEHVRANFTWPAIAERLAATPAFAELAEGVPA